MFSKKGVVVYQIFIYIIAILIFSFILVYGYNAIIGFKGKSEQIAYIKFKTDLVSTIKRVSPDYGTIKKEDFFVGGEYQKVCFVQSYGTLHADAKDRIVNQENHPIVWDSIEDKANKNVFLFTDSLQESFDIGKIDTTDDGYLCIDIINGKAKIQFEGMGDHTCISNWDVDCTP